MCVNHLAQCLLFGKQSSNDRHCYFVFESSGFKETDIIIVNVNFDERMLIQIACLVDQAKCRNILGLFILDCLFYYF